MGYAVVILLVFLLCHEVSSVSKLPHKHQTVSLLEFKQSFTIDTETYPKMSSWNTSRDCCSWDGVVCDEMTGHVIELDLSHSGLVGKIDSNSSLFQLSHLQRLDLSYNNFSNSHISPEFGKFSSLTYLNLFDSYFSGQIPSEISHLSKLHSLYLFSFHTMLRLATHDFKLLLQNLTQLRELDLTFVNISSTIPLNFSSHFTTLELGDTGLYGPVPEFLSNLTSIETLDLSDNSLNGTIPSGIFSLPSLTDLLLQNNQFSGQLEDFKSNSLVRIVLGNNQLQGHLPNSIQDLVNLTFLDLSSNSFSGSADVSLFSDLKQLICLRLSYNNISLTNEKEVKSTLPESLLMLELAACEVKELEFLRSAKRLTLLDISNNKIQGRIPDWAWSNWMVSLNYLFISHNMLTSVDSIPLQLAFSIDLRSNLLQGSLPIPPISTKSFFISHNNLSGQIPSSICNLTSLVNLDFSRNNLGGEIPQCLGNIIRLQVLVMSHNNFGGEIPQCLGNIIPLQVLDMSHNNLSGNIPTTFSNGSTLSSLNFHGNKLEGKIPRSLTNCQQLEVVDLGDNHLNDTFPMWLGTLPKLKVLSLRSNKLHGSIGTLTNQNLFPQLRILDLSSNAFTKNLPASLFQHLKAMRTIDQTMIAPSYGRDAYYEDSVVVVSKGLELEVVRILFLYTTIDLSSNKFEGHIPTNMGDLIALRVLNISHNGLDGPIPPSLGSLSSVESLDLSNNHLVGEIPAQFASLTSLEVLNLSYNHLEGCIPQGPQLQTFETNSYEGNDGLRGFPVSKGCGKDRGSGTNDAVSGQVDDEESNSEFWRNFWKASLMGYGSGLCIGLSILYLMISSGKPIWLARVIVALEHKLMMGRRKKQRRQRQRNYRRRNNES